MSYVLAVALGALFLWSCGAKVASFDDTLESFRAMRMRSPKVVLVLTIGAEALAATTLLVIPSVGGAIAIVLITAFTAVLVSVIRSGVDVRCSCFGSTTTALVGPLDIARNLLMLSAAVFVFSVAERMRPTVVEVVVSSVALAGGVVALALGRSLRR